MSHSNLKLSGLLRRVVGSLVLAGALFSVQSATALMITVGEQDFVDGTTVGGVGAYNTPQGNETAALHNFNGSDFGANFSQSFSFNYAAGAYLGATLSLGLFDYDCFVACDVVATFTVDGTSFAAALAADIMATGQSVNIAYDVFTIDVSSILGALGDGTANVTLTLQPATGGGFNGNGAGLDFAQLNLREAAVPEPGTVALLSLGLLGFSARRRQGASR